MVVGKEALVLQQDGDLGQAHGDVVDDDGGVEGFEVGNGVGWGDGLCVSAEAVVGFYCV